MTRMRAVLSFAGGREPAILVPSGCRTPLPALSEALGHAHLDGTQVYLSMTPELLHAASVRFERYVDDDGADHE